MRTILGTILAVLLGVSVANAQTFEAGYFQARTIQDSTTSTNGIFAGAIGNVVGPVNVYGTFTQDWSDGTSVRALQGGADATVVTVGNTKVGARLGLDRPFGDYMAKVTYGVSVRTNRLVGTIDYGNSDGRGVLLGKLGIRF